MKTRTLSIALVALAAGSAFGARGSLMNVSAQEAMLDCETLGHLAIGQHVLLDNFPMDDGSALDLDLVRFTVLTPESKTIIVDEQGVEHEAGDLGVVLLKGSIVGNPDSTVYVSTSPYGVHGFIKTADATYAISTGPSGADFGHDLGLTVSDAALIRGEESPERVCAVVPGNDKLNQFALPAVAPDGYADHRVRASRETEYAIDTDYEYTANIFGGNASAASAYIQTLIGGVSLIYESDLDVQLKVIWSRVFSANNDPYPGSNYSSRLDHLKNEWDANMTAIHRDGVHMFSGGSPSWGGIAYVNAICYNRGNGVDDIEDFDYGVSAYLNGFFPTPLTDHHSDNWDLVVVAHEMGHNHGTGHTHDINWYNPVIDGCGNGDCSAAFGGTIMSYCHTCSGGMSNIILHFHPRVRDTITFFLDNYAECITAPASPCPCDVDGNSTLNLDDVNAFAAAFASSDLAADMDGNGVLNLDDVNTFAACFTAGCP
ncbi:MAG: M12 family metallo-peptidase [Phycisphaerales bacterium]